MSPVLWGWTGRQEAEKEGRKVPRGSHCRSVLGLCFLICDAEWSIRNAGLPSGVAVNTRVPACVLVCACILCLVSLGVHKCAYVCVCPDMLSPGLNTRSLGIALPSLSPHSLSPACLSEAE